MADTLKRLKNLLKGKSNAWLTDLESKNPKAVMRAASEHMANQRTELGYGLSRAGREVTRLEESLAGVEKELEGLPLEGDAATLHSLRETLTRELEDAQARHVSLLETRDALESEQVALSREEETLLTRHAVASAHHGATDADLSAHESAYARALNSVRERTQSMEEQAQTARGAEAYAKAKAQSALAALKKERTAGATEEKAPPGTQGEPTAPDDGADPSETETPNDGPIPRRTL